MAEEIRRNEAPTSNEETKAINQIVSDEMGVIAENTKIIGDITSNGHLAIAGYVEGNVDVKGNMVISGTVKGDIACNNLLIKDGNIITNSIKSTGIVQLDQTVHFKGKIYCNSISLAGEVIGDIVADDKVVLSSSAKVKGSITAKTIATEFGCVIDGKVKIG